MSRQAPREPHAITRARERYGIELSRAGLKRIEEDCAQGRSLVLGRWGGDARHAVLHEDRALIVVIGADGRAKTVLPRTAARQSWASMAFRRSGA